MKYYVDGKIITISDNQKKFNSGSEGKLYKIDNYIYKIYYPNTLNEGFGNKKIYHQSLLGISDKFESIVLPTSLIFDELGNYVGYKCPMVGENDKIGLTELDWNIFIENIEKLEEEILLLSENRFLAVDFAFHNSIYSKEMQKLYMVDPGRYHHQAYFTLNDYINKNKLILEEYIFHMLEREIISYKLTTPKKATMLIKSIASAKEDLTYSEYFYDNSAKYENVHEMIKVKSRYIK